MPDDFDLFGLAVMRRNQVYNDEGRRLGVNVSRRTAEATRDNRPYDSQLCFIDPGGAGHYAKSARDGIEYGDMQLICEAYALFRAAGFGTGEMADIFDEWNRGDRQSYLIQITAKALRQNDPKTDQPVVDLILDQVGQKGTGQWTLMNAIENTVVVSAINAAVEARVPSSMKAARGREPRPRPVPPTRNLRLLATLADSRSD